MLKVFWFIRRISKVPFLGRVASFLNRLICVLYGSSIPLSVKFETKANFPHGLNGIFISGSAVFGKNVTIYHQVTVGSNMLYGSRLGSPIIEDNVVLSAGSKVVGPVRVGSNSIVGAGCTINRDLEDSTIAVAAATKFQNKSGINRVYTTIKGDYYYHFNGKLEKELDEDRLASIKRR